MLLGLRQSFTDTAAAHFPSDTAAAVPYSFEDAPQDSAAAWRKPTTPREVLRQLPRDATPAQQDSAVQTALDIPPARILTARPDTLCIPGLKGSPANVDLSRYGYKENYFSGSPYFHPELHIIQTGMAAEPVPYRMRDDDYVTGTLLASFLLTVLFLARTRRILLEKTKDFFFVRGNSGETAVKTDYELRGQALLVVQASFLLAVLFLDYTQERLPHVFNSVSPYVLLGADAGICLLYHAVKVAAYLFANWVFFDKRRRELWMESYVFTIIMTGMASFPLVLLRVYFSLPFRALAAAFLATLALSETLLLVKCRRIFSGVPGGPFHMILYFCTLELAPLLLLWRALAYSSELLAAGV